MKKILIQDRSGLALDSVEDILNEDFQGIFEIETAHCLSRTKSNISQYSLIVSHPHIIEDRTCCVPYLEKAKKEKIPIILTYKMLNPEKELRAISEDLNVNLKQRFLGAEFYVNLIKSLEGKF